jgi:serine/threonine protein kinase
LSITQAADETRLPKEGSEDARHARRYGRYEDAQARRIVLRACVRLHHNMGQESVDNLGGNCYIAAMRYPLPFALDDQFVLLREIKAGGFGIVYAGWDENLNLPIAVKEIHPELLQHEDGLKAFLAEAQMIARLDHRGIARLYTLKRSQGRVFMILEYIDGGDLRQLQSYLKERARRLAPTLCLYIIREVAKALHYAHVRVDPSTGAALHLVHRDIAPSNFMISRQGAVKLIDFGIARVAGVMRPETMGGVIKGRPQYMSPEQIAAPETLDHRSDIYSLAVVLLDMLTGQSVYGRTTNEYQLLDRVKGRQFDLPAYFAEHALPDALRPPIEHALKLAPPERTATAREFIEQLEAYGQAVGYDEKKAQSELREAAEQAFPVSNLKHELEQFRALRDSAATVTMQMPRAPVGGGATRTIATEVPRGESRSDTGEPRTRKPLNWTGIVLALIAVGFAVAFVFLLMQQSPAKHDTSWALTAEDSLRLREGRAQDSTFAATKRVQDSLSAAASRPPLTTLSAPETPDEPSKVETEKQKVSEPSRVLPKLERAGESAVNPDNGFVVRSSIAATVSIGGNYAGRVGSGESLSVPAPDSRVAISFRVESGNGCAQTRTFDGIFAGSGGQFDPDTSLVMAIIRFAGSSRAGVATQIRSLSANVTLDARCETMEPGRDYRFLPGMYEITTTAPGMNPRVEKRYLSAGKLISYQAG